MKKGNRTRERLMDIAQSSIVEKGFAATSIEEIIAAADITKSGFFYHFPDKTSLALALLERYRLAEDEVFDGIFDRARQLSDDPLQSFLIGLTLLAETLGNAEEAFPCCLVATFVYQDKVYDRSVAAINREITMGWRRRFRAHLDQIAALYPPRDGIDLDTVADFVSTTVEGSMVMARALGEQAALPAQILVLRSYIKLLFQPPVH